MPCTRDQPAVPVGPVAMIVVLLVLSAALAGCVADEPTAPTRASDPASGDEAGAGAPRLVTETFSGEATGAGSGFYVWLASDTVFDLEVPERTFRLSLTLTWSTPQADLDLIVTDPAEGTAAHEGGAPGSGDSPVLAEVSDPLPGTWSLGVFAKAAAGEAFLIEAVMLVGDAPDGRAGPVAHASSSRTDVKEGSPTVERQGTRYRASREVTFTTDLRGIDEVAIALGTVNGDVLLQGARDGDSIVVAHLHADGDTEDEARQRLARLSVDHRFEDRGATGVLEAFARNGEGDHWESQGVSFDAAVPSRIAYDVSAGATNGDVTVTGVDGGTTGVGTTNGDVSLCDMHAEDITLVTTNGAVTVQRVRASGTLQVSTTNGEVTFGDTVARSVEAFTTNGGVSGDLGADDADLGATNGAVRMELFASASGSIHVETTNGAIELLLPEDADRGYDLEALTSRHSRVTIELDDVETVDAEDDHYRHVRTTDYDERGIQTTVDAGTTNGDIRVASANASLLPADGPSAHASPRPPAGLTSI